MIKWIFLGLILALAIKDISGGVPLMVIAPMVSTVRTLISSITESVAPGHNQIKDPFALSDDSLKSIAKINEYIAKNNELVKGVPIIVANTEDQLANINQRIFEIDDIAQKVLNKTEITNLNLNKVLIKAQYVVSELPKIAAHIDTRLTELMSSLEKRLRVDRNFRVASKTLADHIQHIQSMYEEYISNLNPKVPLVPMTYENLFGAVISNGANAIQDNLAQIEAQLTGAENDKKTLYKGFLSFFNNKGKLMAYEERCGLGDTYQNRLKNLYNLISINEYRAIVMLVIAHKYYEIHGDKPADDTIYVLFEGYVNRTIHHLTAMKEAMALASTEIIECDPPQYRLDVDAFSLTNLFSMVYFSTDQIGLRCSRSCPKINTVNKLGCKTEIDDSQGLTVTEYCPKHQCNGRIYDCKVKNYKEFCEAYDGAGVKYHWIENPVTDDMRMSCNGRWVDIMKKSKCNECLCKCAAEGAESTATRTISLIPQFSNVSDNRVVTNIRFRKKDNVVHVQIEEARLLPGGEIDPDTRHWVPLDDLVYLQNTPEGGFAKIKGKERIMLVSDVDYTFLNKDKKTLYLDDITVDKDYIVTGIAFKNALENPEGGQPNLSPIQLQIFKTKFDYQEGVLSTVKGEQHIPVVANNVTQSYNIYYSHARSERVIGKVKPSLERNRNNDLSNANMQLDFVMTPEAGLGKAVVPFFDARPASAESQVPLSGLGVVHRRFRGYGGFISPKLIGLDHSQYVVTDLTNEQRKELVEAFKIETMNLKEKVMAIPESGGSTKHPKPDEVDEDDVDN